MPTERILIAPPNLQFFISDPKVTDISIQKEKISIISSSECISVPCQYWEEGDTELVVGNFGDIVEEDEPVFDVTISTPSGVVVFTDAELSELLTFPATAPNTRIRIWTDGSMLPDRVVVGVG